MSDLEIEWPSTHAAKFAGGMRTRPAACWTWCIFVDVRPVSFAPVGLQGCESLSSPGWRLGLPSRARLAGFLTDVDLRLSRLSDVLHQSTDTGICSIDVPPISKARSRAPETLFGILIGAVVAYRDLCPEGGGGWRAIRYCLGEGSLRS